MSLTLRIFEKSECSDETRDVLDSIYTKISRDPTLSLLKKQVAPAHKSIDQDEEPKGDFGVVGMVGSLIVSKFSDVSSVANTLISAISETMRSRPKSGVEMEFISEDGTKKESFKIKVTDLTERSEEVVDDFVNFLKHRQATK
jgi:hypothetical protein